MRLTLRGRTEETVAVYFEKASAPDIRRVLPQRAATLEEALADYRQTLLPGARSYGRTIWADGSYIGDVWCYCMDLRETPSAMVSYCVFDPAWRNRGAATAALDLFLQEIRDKFGLSSVGAFTYAANRASIRVLEKSGFRPMETFTEDGVASIYYQREL